MTDIVERLRDDRYRALPSQRAEAADEIERLRKAIQDYLHGNYGPQQGKCNECPHGKFGWEHCVGCIDEYFAGVLAHSSTECGDPL